MTMGELINLRQRRKRRAREEKEQRATEKRVLHGRTKAERTQQENAKARSVARLEGHKREEKRDGATR